MNLTSRISRTERLWAFYGDVEQPFGESTRSREPFLSQFAPWEVMAKRWGWFNLVGLMGFLVQTAILAALVRWAGVTTGVAVALAVLAAVSHNFFWHERFTWPNLPREGRVRRWVSFHLSTGVISVLSNVWVTTALVAATGLPVVAANVVAVSMLSLTNFWISDRLVFRE
jgi:putative flippase GtrA